jgi:hypothetical protein
MKPSRNVQQGRRVFITGLRSFDVVYLPDSGQIVSMVGPGALALPAEESLPEMPLFDDDVEEDGDR